MDEFDQHNIPKRRNVLYSVAKRAIQGEPLLLPLTQKQNAKEYVKQ